MIMRSPLPASFPARARRLYSTSSRHPHFSAGQDDFAQRCGVSQAKTDAVQRENADAFGRPPCFFAASTSFDDAPHRPQGVSSRQKQGGRSGGGRIKATCSTRSAEAIAFQTSLNRGGFMRLICGYAGGHAGGHGNGGDQAIGPRPPLCGNIHRRSVIRGGADI